jgi:electron transport complex protein RnfC
VRRLHDFHGGVFPPERKTLSSETPIAAAGIPPQLVLPLSQHIGPPAEIAVAVGDRVLGGQRLTDLSGLPVHAPTSGTIAAIEDRPVPHPSGLEAPCIVIDCDGEDRWIELEPCDGGLRADPETLRQQIHAAGIAGLGGAGFPTSRKLDPAAARKIHTLIINGTECEPYITADDRLMRERAAQIVSGAEILARLVDPAQIIIGIEDNKPQAIAAMESALAGREDMAIATFPTKYPSGGEKQLIEILTGRQVPSGGLPADIGILCQNVGTAVAVHDAVLRGRPLVSRVTTVTGEAVARPGNYDVLLGTPMSYLMSLAGCDREQVQRLVMGGPMMGISLRSDTCPVIKTTNCLLLPTAGELPPPPPMQACIRCGHCAEVCPARLLPQQLYWYARAEDQDNLEAHNLFDCIECGACSYVCPSHIPLVQYYRAAKGTIRDRRAAEAKSEHARLRFEARQARMEREAAAKEARRAARKRAALAKAADKPQDGDDPIQAAIARAQAKRAEQASNPAAAQSAQADKISRIEARLAKAREKLAADEGADEALTAALKKAVAATEAKLAAARLEAEAQPPAQPVSHEGSVPAARATEEESGAE